MPRRPFQQRCSFPGCKNTWKSRKPQEGAWLFCYAHQAQTGHRNSGRDNWEQLQLTAAPDTIGDIG